MTNWLIPLEIKALHAVAGLGSVDESQCLVRFPDLIRRFGDISRLLNLPMGSFGPFSPFFMRVRVESS